MFSKWQILDEHDDLNEFIRIEYRNLSVAESFNEHSDKTFMSTIKNELLSEFRWIKDKEKGQPR